MKLTPTFFKYLKPLTLVLSLFMLTACGGGEGGDEDVSSTDGEGGITSLCLIFLNVSYAI